MKPKIIFSSVMVALLVFTASIISQDKKLEDVRWSMDPSTKVRLVPDYAFLPQADNYVNPNTQTRVVQTPIGTFTVAPNFRPYPHTATQSEIDAVTMRDSSRIFWCAWNSYGPSFYGTGFASTTNSGANWIGSHQTFTPNSGDPAVWIWPGGSSWPARFGHSVIQGAGHSTNYGATWVFDMNFPGASSFDKNLSAVDDVPGSPFYGRAYTVWTNFGGTYAYRIVGSYSTNGGANWSTAAPVSPPRSTGHHHQGCDVEVGPGGVVYVVWGNCITNGQNSTEDSLGFARSTDGGVTWAVSVNNAVNVNGIRTSNLFNGIRANGFPRIDVDKTGGSRNGWIYAVLSEKTVAPATDASDVTMCRSTDGGTTWTHTRVNQDTPGSGRFQYFGAVVVDPNGGVNVVYYDQRNTTGYVTQVYVSRSTDGGNTWTDIQVSDHDFTPAPIPGLAGGYQGDYISITYSGSDVWPFWCDNSSGIYQCWTTSFSILNPDLWSKDRKHDTGIEPNPDNGPMWMSYDMWVRRQADGFTHLHKHQNPIYRDSILYPNNPNYIYVMVRNRGGSAGSGVLKVYWSKASTGLKWPTHWINYYYKGVLSGNQVYTPSPILINNLAAGDSIVFEIPWFPPNPNSYKFFKGDRTHFCLLSRIETSPVYPYGMTFPEGPSVNKNTRNNNNIVWKNITIIRRRNPLAQTEEYTGWVTIRNTEPVPAMLYLGLDIPEEEQKDPFLNYGNITIDLGDTLFPKWLEAGAIGSEIELNGNLINVTGLDAFVSGVMLEPEETFTIGVSFELKVVPAEPREFNFDVIQSAYDKFGDIEVIGGERFVFDLTEEEILPEEQVGKVEINVYPNPFNPVVNIAYTLPTAQKVVLKIYDVLGREVATLVNEVQEKGKHTMSFDGTHLSSGIYFYRVQIGSIVETRKIVLVK